MENLGINVQSMAIYFALFLILFVVLDRKVLPSLRKSVERRKELIEEGLKARGEVEKELKTRTEEISQKESEVIKDAKAKAADIVALAEKEAADIVEKAKKKSAIMLEESKDLIEKYRRVVENA